MGWGSGSEVVSGLIKCAMKHLPDSEKRASFYEDVLPVFENQDWDTQADCLGEDLVYDAWYQKQRIYYTVERFLKEGLLLHAFRSGGGLRVLRVDEKVSQKDKALAYGESFDVWNAFRILADDMDAGGRPYSEVYGNGKLEVHYLTGCSSSSDPLDHWLLHGNTFDIYRDGQELTIEMWGSPYDHAFDRLRDHVLPSQVQIGSRILKTGKSTSLQEALKKAIASEPQVIIPKA